MKLARRLGLGIVYLFLLGYLVFSLFPFYWTVITSFKDANDVLRRPEVLSDWLPPVDFSSYRAVFESKPFAHYLLNSLIVACTVTALAVVLGSLAAYALSALRFRGRHSLFLFILGTRLVPPIALVVPFYFVLQALRMVDTRAGLALANIFQSLPLAVWIIKNFIDAAPRALYEAAKIDGCSEWQTAFRVVLPIAVPGLVTAAIIAFVFTWNEYEFALSYARTQAKTIPVGLTDFFQDGFIEWNQLTAGTVIAILPGLLFVLVFQRYLRAGILGGAVKG